MKRIVITRSIMVLTLMLISTAVLGQNLNWEGQTGAFVTPFAYTAASPANGFGRPAVAFHFLNGGPVVGNDFQLSITEGLLKRVEVGYTRALQSSGSAALAPLFNGGFNIFHGKVNIVSENAGKQKWVPAVSVGFVARTQVRRVGGVATAKDTKNGDIYLVGTKVLPVKHLPILVNAGLKGTNASLLGIAGNAPEWKATGFGAVAFILSGPAKSKIAVGSEVAQQPHHIKDLPTATLPTTLTYFVRAIPASVKHPFNIDFGVAQAAGRVLPGADVQARARFAFGLSYRL